MGICPCVTLTILTLSFTPTTWPTQDMNCQDKINLKSFFITHLRFTAKKSVIFIFTCNRRAISRRIQAYAKATHIASTQKLWCGKIESRLLIGNYFYCKNFRTCIATYKFFPINFFDCLALFFFDATKFIRNAIRQEHQRIRNSFWSTSFNFYRTLICRSTKL